jgi:hypothetical protein
MCKPLLAPAAALRVERDAQLTIASSMTVAEYPLREWLGISADIIRTSKSSSSVQLDAGVRSRHGPIVRPRGSSKGFGCPIN